MAHIASDTVVWPTCWPKASPPKTFKSPSQLSDITPAQTKRGYEKNSAPNNTSYPTRTLYT